MWISQRQAQGRRSFLAQNDFAIAISKPVKATIEAVKRVESFMVSDSETMSRKISLASGTNFRNCCSPWLSYDGMGCRAFGVLDGEKGEPGSFQG